jgi:hypothetical protein
MACEADNQGIGSTFEVRFHAGFRLKRAPEPERSVPRRERRVYQPFGKAR